MKRRNAVQGFTLVEILMVLAIASVLLMVMQTFFYRSVKSTIKGQDNLDTIRAASQLFRELRKDLLACHSIKVPDAASCTIEVGDEVIPPFPADANKISFRSQGETVTYSLEEKPDGRKYIKRLVESATHPDMIKEFGVPRMLGFKALQIWKKQQIYSGAPFTEGQVLLEIEIDSEDKRFPSKNLKLTSFFISSQLSASKWNYY